MEEKIMGKMKAANFGKIFVLVGAILVPALFGSCRSLDMSTSLVGWSDYAGIVVKDYEAVEIVIVKRSETFVYGPLGLSTTHTGSQITYEDLMQEAKRLGAHDVINVRIDRNETSETSLVSRLSGYERVINYTATALAIRYTGAEPDVAASKDVLRNLK
jgi:uncharacterized protein YbjQ (UPF0145 family)